MHLPSSRRLPSIRALLSVLALSAATSMAGSDAASLAANDRADDADRSPVGESPRQDPPIIGAALEIVADGTRPWEDRPFLVPDLGDLTGVAGEADPGDDLGPHDGVVRSWDAVIYQASFSVRNATASDVVVEVTLHGPAQWEASQVEGLRLRGCPGGALLWEQRTKLRCLVGDVVAPPALTAALELTARVSGSSLQGDAISASMTVRSLDGAPDPDTANCPTPRDGGCDAASGTVTVSASPAAELRKRLVRVNETTHQGRPGRSMTWQLELVLGADGDVRGTSLPVGGPWTVTDWWDDRANSGSPPPVELIRCPGTFVKACSQTGGPGAPVAVVFGPLNLTSALPNGVTSSQPQVVASSPIELWVAEADLAASRRDVILKNCFATELGSPDRTVWRPLDAAGQPNLGGAAEPPANNCAEAILPRPATPTPTPTPTQRPATRVPPPRTPTPWGSLVTKNYAPITSGARVTDGAEFAADVGLTASGGGGLAAAVVCDKWDNSTHRLRDGGVAGVRIWRRAGTVVEQVPADQVIVEYGTGPWGARRGPSTSIGRAWYTQATASCHDRAPVVGVGWVSASDVDFSNGGAAALNADDVNMVRARFVDPVPSGTRVWAEVLFSARSNPPGTWLMNYGAGAWGAGTPRWLTGVCHGATGGRNAQECPEPALGSLTRPGTLGDMLFHVGVPLWVAKRTDPVIPGGSPVVEAGDTVAFVIQASTSDPPGSGTPPEFASGAIASGVVVTDTLPSGLVYRAGSATVESEDLNGNQRLDPGEDRNSNGRIDLNAPFEPELLPGAGFGEVVLRWTLGDLPYAANIPSIRYEADVSRLARGGSSVTNSVAIAQSTDKGPDCSEGNRQQEGRRCAWAQVIVSNVAAAQVEKVAVQPVILPGTPFVFNLALANLTSRPAEWFDAVDILPRAGEERSPQSRLSGPIAAISARILNAGAPIEVWASASDPDQLDSLNGAPRDGLVDPVSAWGGPGQGLAGRDWPCKLEAVAGPTCLEIPSASAITALRFWGPDPDPVRSGGTASFLPSGGDPRWIELTLDIPGAQPADLAHNAWGGRFESLPLPVFDNALVVVRPPDTPTPTITPTPSTTPRGSTATQTSPPASATPTFQPRPIYLPVLLHIPCIPRLVDVVLVLDASSSMLRDAGDGGTKQMAVMRAAQAFLDEFDPETSGGQVAIVAFNHRAWEMQALTTDRAKLDRALASLPELIDEGTRLDLGLLAGADALAAAPLGRVRAMVFLTDGLPNRVPTPVPNGRMEDVVLEAARNVRSSGIVIHTVGYGQEHAPDLADRILPWLLREIAGSSGGYHQTDDASGLAIRFSVLARDVWCATDRVWP